METKKFVHNEDGYDWNFYCDNSIPLITISKVNQRISTICFDIWPLVKFDRFVIINYPDHIIPLYNLYVQYSKLPKKHYFYSGGSNNAMFNVLRRDAEDIAIKLYDLIYQLHQLDEELFSYNPIEVKEGFNSEGYNEEMEKAEFKSLSDEDLISKYKMQVFADRYFKYKYRYVELFHNEMESRNIPIKKYW